MQLATSHLPALIFRSNATLYLTCLIVRLVNYCIVTTSFNPDEYWQLLEVAYNLVWHDGTADNGVTWEWRRNVALRSAILPVLLSAWYRLLRYWQLDTQYTVAYTPMLLQAIASSVQDYYTYHLALKLFNNNQKTARYTLYLTWCSWFMTFTAVRTLSNVMEMDLTVVALYYWPLMDDASEIHMPNLPLAVLLAALCIIIRPTAALMWLALGLHLLYRLGCWQRCVEVVAKQVLPAATLVVTTGTLVDYHYYQQWVFVPLNFLRFNTGSSGSVSALYGVHPWHWYVTQSWPQMLGTSTPLFAVAAYTAYWSQAHTIQSRSVRLLCNLILLNTVFYSLNPHKEFRFLLQSLPLVLICCAAYLATMSDKHTVGRAKKADTSTEQTIEAGSSRYWWHLIVPTNLLMAVYFCQFHQRGTITVMPYLTQRAVEISAATNTSTVAVDFLMPCHATPLYSHAHIPSHQGVDLQLNYLDCSPLFVDGKLYGNGYNECSQRNLFDRDALQFVQTYYDAAGEAVDIRCDYVQYVPSKLSSAASTSKLLLHTQPDMLVMFDYTSVVLRDWLMSHKYNRSQRLFHSHLDDAKYVDVYDKAR